MRIDWRAGLREVLVHTLFFLPRRRSIAFERRLRGGEDFRRLQSADCIIVSFPNSGRTWLRVLLARYYRARDGLAGVDFSELDGMSNGGRRVPRFFFTHDNYLRDYTGDGSRKQAYAGRCVVLLVRDPADAAVSQYFQWKHRMRRRKIAINDYPPDPELSLFDFVLRQDGGLPRIIRFLNAWAEALPQLQEVRLLRYEDLRREPERCLAELLDFIGTPGAAGPIGEAIAFASLETMRALEDRGDSLMRSGRMKVESDPNRYKARRAKVGGYRNDFSEAEVAAIDHLINTTLAAVFGYGRGTPTASEAPAKRER